MRHVEAFEAVATLFQGDGQSGCLQRHQVRQAATSTCFESKPNVFTKLAAAREVSS
jgi:hypothetical protein